MGDIIHRDKLFNGQTTAERLHAELAWYGKKCLCGSPPAMRIQVFILLSDMVAEQRDQIEIQIAKKQISVANLGPGRAVRWADVYPCMTCSPAAERAAAKAPSYAVVDIERSPGPENPVVGVISAL